MSHTTSHSHRSHRRRTQQHSNPALLPLNDQNSWYYPSNGYSSEDAEDEEASTSVSAGNWGRKRQKNSRWVRSGKMTAWGPRMEEWEAEERCRKRLKLLIPQEERSPSPPTLPHLERSPTPPLVMPYPQPRRQHSTYTSFVLDKAVTHTFRSGLLGELEEVTNRLIEGEAAVKMALGKLWQVINEQHFSLDAAVVPKQEDQEGEPNEAEESRAQRLARAPDLTPPTHKLFLSQNMDSETFAPEANLEKSLATLRELQDDRREYVERLDEIRNSLGDVRWQRERMWEEVRQRAIGELQETARATVDYDA